jgi:hypothetical protein
VFKKPHETVEFISVMHFVIIYFERKAAKLLSRQEKLSSFCLCVLCEYLMILEFVYLSLRPLRLTTDILTYIMTNDKKMD